MTQENLNVGANTMGPEKVYITWDDVRERLRSYDVEGQKIYGVPSGGLMACALLKHAEHVTTIQESTMILDDLIDSGCTQAHYLRLAPTKPFVALFNKDEEFKERWIVFPWDIQHPGTSLDGEINTAEHNIVRMLQAIGEDPTRDGLLETPKRVVKSWKEIYGGYHMNVEDVFKTFDGGSYDQMVIMKEFEFYSCCEHHMLPFFGKAHVAYIPNKKVIGLSKLARLVDVYSKRLQIQERIGEQVVDALMKYLAPKGAACVLEASHMCVCMRGVNKQNSMTETLSLRGAFKDDTATRNEFLSRIKN